MGAVSDLQSKILMQDLIERSGTQPIYLSSVEIVGGENFSSNFFKKVLGPLTDNSDYTLGQLLQNIDSSYVRLMKTDVFKKVDVSLHSDYVKQLPGVATYNNEPSIPTKVVFDLAPVKLSTGDISLNLNSDEEFSVDLNYLNKNFYENGETIDLQATYSPYKPHEYLLSNAKVAFGLPNPLFKLVSHLYNSHSDNKIWQHLQEHTTGVLSGLQFISQCKNLKSFVGVGFSKRTVHDIEDEALDEVKFFAGDFWKKALIAKANYSNIDEVHGFPVNGATVDLLAEASTDEDSKMSSSGAGSGPVSPIIKSTASVQLFRSFCSNYITTHVSLDVGGIFTTSPSPASIHTSDRFYLGGFNSLRGFAKNSINGDGSGGYQFYNARGSIFAQLPSSIHKSKHASGEASPLRLYATGAVGNISGKNDCVFLRENNHDAATSVGAGLRYFNEWANFDIGYYVAGRLNGDNSGAKDGLQISISIGGSNKHV